MHTQDMSWFRGWKYINFIPEVNPLQEDSFTDGSIFQIHSRNIVRKTFRQPLKKAADGTYLYWDVNVPFIIPPDFNEGYQWKIYAEAPEGPQYPPIEIALLPTDWYFDSDSQRIIFYEEQNFSNEVTFLITLYYYASGHSGAVIINNGGSGKDGVSGYSGYSGYSGERGFSGYSGAQGKTGTGNTGTSGKSGYSGYSGRSGYSGAGTPGESGYSGYSGYGSQGESGYSGYSGYSGKDGRDGNGEGGGESGYSGYSGYSGAKGERGYNGAGGRSFARLEKDVLEGDYIIRFSTYEKITPGMWLVMEPYTTRCEIRMIHHLRPIAVEEDGRQVFDMVIDNQMNPVGIPAKLAHPIGAEIYVKANVHADYFMYGAKRYIQREDSDHGMGRAFHGDHNYFAINRAHLDVWESGLGIIHIPIGSFYTKGTVRIYPELSVRGYGIHSSGIAADPTWTVPEGETQFVLGLFRNNWDITMHPEWATQNARNYLLDFSVGGGQPRIGGISLSGQQPGWARNIRVNDCQEAPGILMQGAQQFQFDNIMVIGCHWGLYLRSASFMWFHNLNVEHSKENHIKCDRLGDEIPNSMCNFTNVHMEGLSQDSKTGVDIWCESFSGEFNNVLGSSGSRHIFHMESATYSLRRILINYPPGSIMVSDAETGKEIRGDGDYHGFIGELHKTAAIDDNAWFGEMMCPQGSHYRWGIGNGNRPMLDLKTNSGTTIKATSAYNHETENGALDGTGFDGPGVSGNSVSKGPGVSGKGKEGAGVRASSESGKALEILGSVSQPAVWVTKADVGEDGFYNIPKHIGRIMVKELPMKIRLPGRTERIAQEIIIEDGTGVCSPEAPIEVFAQDGTILNHTTGTPVTLKRPFIHATFESHYNMYTGRITGFVE